jgi:hypothetical protein
MLFFISSLPPLPTLPLYRRELNKEKKMETIEETDETKQVEHVCMQEYTSLPVEDRSLSAGQVLTQQAEQENRPSLFVP